MDRSKIDAYILRLINDSTYEYTAWNLEKKRAGKKTNWNYIDGCMITALLEVGHITGKQLYFDFAEDFISHFIEEDGSIRTYKPDAVSVDDINEGRVLFELYEKTGKEKYKKAADFLRSQLEKQPRTPEGNFWHKGIYPNQVWLDGIYMAQPFYVLYQLKLGNGDISDTVRQIRNVHTLMRDEDKGLYYHGYDASRSMFWADPETGCSRNFWLRSLGWFAVALVDIIGMIPDGAEKDELSAIFSGFMQSMLVYRDAESAMYWQVPDQPGREGNYLETSGSSMMSYAMLKGARLGVLDQSFAARGLETFEGISDRYLSFTGDTLNLGGICLVAGLGPADNLRRDGSYEYYISEPIVENDAKGVAPFVLAYTEVMRFPD